MAKKKKCCGKHCFHILCFPVWGVIIIGIALGLFLMFFDCSIMMEIPFEEFPVTMLMLSTACIYIVVFFAIIFLILIKIPAKCGCCSCFTIILLIIHLLLIAISGYWVCTYQDHTLVNVINILTKTKRIQDPPGKLSPFFADYQTSKNCCGLINSSDYGVIILPRTLISSCPNGTVDIASPPSTPRPAPGGSSNLTLPATKKPIKTRRKIETPKGCALKLWKTYQDCDRASCRYTLVMLILGVIPFICYTLVYRKAIKDQKKEEDEEDAEAIAEEEAEAEENRIRDETAAGRSQPHSNQNNNTNINNNNNNSTSNNTNPPPQAPAQAPAPAHVPQVNNERAGNTSTPTPANV